MDSIAAKLLKVAQAQVGYAETGSGYTKFGDWYYQKVDHSYSGFKTAAWCDMFTAWAADQAGVKASVGEFAYTPGHAEWFQKHNAWGHTPEPGALVFYSWSGSKSVGDIDHVGIVESVSGSTIHTIEANVDGGNLKRKTRDQSQVVGYGYPSRVKVAQAAPAAVPAANTRPAPAERGYTPRHSKPGPAREKSHDLNATNTAATTHDMPVPVSDEGAMTGLLSVILLGSVVLAVGKSKALPALPAVRVRKRGRHHRTVEVAAGDAVLLDQNFVETQNLPVIPAVADDSGFWDELVSLEEDEELEFWSSLHASVSQSDSEAPVASRI